MNSRRFITIVVLLTALSACRREPVLSEDLLPILFSTEGISITGAASKAETADGPSQEGSLLADGATMGVFATWTSPDNISTDMFSNIPVVCRGDAVSGFQWEYEPHKYWRRTGTYDFRAVFPYSAVTQFGTNGQHLVVSYSMVSEDYDLMVAGAQRNMTGLDFTSVVLPFKHACAAVRVLFKRAESDRNHRYYLQSFEMKNLNAVGVLVYRGGSLDENAWNLADNRIGTLYPWSAPNEAGTIQIPDSYADFKTIGSYGWKQWHYVIPQHLNASSGARPSLQYSIYVERYADDQTTLLYRSPSPVYTTLELPLTYRDAGNVEHEVVWQPGKVYNYLVEIQNGNVKIDVTTSDWDSYYVYIDETTFD